MVTSIRAHVARVDTRLILSTLSGLSKHGRSTYRPRERLPAEWRYAGDAMGPQRRHHAKRRTPLSLSALPTTNTLDSAIAAAAAIGESSIPVIG